MSNRYPTYKSSGVEWIGEIPAHWRCTRLKYLVTLRNEKTANGCELTIALENIESGTGVILTSSDENPLEGEMKRFNKDDVLFNKLRPYLAKVVQAPSAGCCVGELLVLTPKALTSRFLFYRLISSGFITEVNSSTYGSKMPRASWEDFISLLHIPYPEKSEQQDIADYLDQKTALIDKTIQKKQRLIELLQEERTALINRAVTRGLNPDVKLKPSGAEWLGDVPEHWEVSKVGKVTRIKRGAGYQYLNESVADGEPLEKVLRISDFSKVDPISVRYITELEKYRVAEGDILIAGTGATAGITLFIDKSLDGFVHSYNALRLTTSAVHPKYLYYCLKSHFFLQQMNLSFTGSAQHFLDVGRIANFVLCLPPISEQQEIVLMIDSLFKKTETTIALMLKEIYLLQEYRTALINEVVTGKRCVLQGIEPAEKTTYLSASLPGSMAAEP